MQKWLGTRLVPLPGPKREMALIRAYLWKKDRRNGKGTDYERWVPQGSGLGAILWKIF